MSKTIIELNRSEITAFLKSNEVASILQEAAEKVAGRAGAGATTDVHQMPGRLVAGVFSGSGEFDDEANNRLLSAIGGAE